MPKLPVVSPKKFCTFLEQAGCTLARVVGDHHIYVKAGLKRPIVVPLYEEVPVFVVLNNLRTLGVTRTEFISMMKKI